MWFCPRVFVSVTCVCVCSVCTCVCNVCVSHVCVHKCVVCVHVHCVHELSGCVYVQICVNVHGVYKVERSWQHHLSFVTSPTAPLLQYQPQRWRDILKNAVSQRLCFRFYFIIRHYSNMFSGKKQRQSRQDGAWSVTTSLSDMVTRLVHTHTYTHTHVENTYTHICCRQQTHSWLWYSATCTTCVCVCT